MSFITSRWLLLEGRTRGVILGYGQGRQFLSRSGGDESRDLPSFADFSLALSYIMLISKVWTPGGGARGWPLGMPLINSEKSDIQLNDENQ